VFVQLLQYYYQKGCLYRLRALGEKEDMDTTVGRNFIKYIISSCIFSRIFYLEGFQSWMTRGLSFLLPFLIFGYVCKKLLFIFSIFILYVNLTFKFWELYNSYLLYDLTQSTDFQDEWQVPALSFIFFVLFSGNMITT